MIENENMYAKVLKDCFKLTALTRIKRFFLSHITIYIGYEWNKTNNFSNVGLIS